MWELEAVGIDSDQTRETSSDEFLSDIWKGSITQDKGRYTVKLPGKSSQCKELLLDNKEQALKRSKNLNRKLDKNPELKKKYNKVLIDFESNGYIEEVLCEETSEVTSK